jgi:hypothetical protein
MDLQIIVELGYAVLFEASFIVLSSTISIATDGNTTRLMDSHTLIQPLQLE